MDTRLIHKGKVRDIYGYDDKHLLFKTSNRISAFDVILPTEVPNKGQILNRVSGFWKNRFEHILPNDLTDIEISDNTGQYTVVKKLRPLPIEAVVRGYIIGSGWKDYQRAGSICGNVLPEGLQLAQNLPTVLYTPSTKAAVGDHDENITFDRTVELLGDQLATRVADISVLMYKQAAQYAMSKGIIIADTKFEFGLDDNDELHLIDEVLTPDSSRFWATEDYQVGVSPPSFDKQIVRDYLETLDWDKTSPGPELPPDLVAKVASKYETIANRLIGE